MFGRKSRKCVGRRYSSYDAGWSSPVAREAHNLEVVGSNPAPATDVVRLPGERTQAQSLRTLATAEVFPCLETTHGSQFHPQRSQGAAFSTISVVSGRWPPCSG